MKKLDTDLFGDDESINIDKIKKKMLIHIKKLDHNFEENFEKDEEGISNFELNVVTYKQAIRIDNRTDFESAKCYCYSGYLLKENSICVYCGSNCERCILGKDNLPYCLQCYSRYFLYENK